MTKPPNSSAPKLVEDYSVSQTTLEQVFIRFAHEHDVREHDVREHDVREAK